MSDGCTTTLWGPNVVWLQPNFCASLHTSGLSKPRGLHIETNAVDGDEILLVERGRSRVVRLDDDGAAVVSVAEIGDPDCDNSFACAGNLNHGIEVAGGYLYASTPTTVYRWPYKSGQTTAGGAGDAQTVIVGMDRTANSDELGAPGGHTTRTLAFDYDKRWLYVSTGSRGNVDADSFRSRIRRFDMSTWDESQPPLQYTEGEVFADGLRNEVGLAFDSFGDLWGVENGADRLYREDLGGSIVNENPAEELNRFREDQRGQTWGYPHCWSEYCLSVENGGSGMKGANTVWAWPSFIDKGYTDQWCRENTNQSVMSMPSHSAPLGLTFYDWRSVSREEYSGSGCEGGFPKAMNKFAFIAFHGSWNRSPPTGYKVVYIPFDDDGNPTALPIDLLRNNGNQAKWPEAFRPVDVQFDSCGRLLVTEDGTGNVVKITYSGDYFDGEYTPIETDVADGPSCSPYQRPIPAQPPNLFPQSTAVPSASSGSGIFSPNAVPSEQQPANPSRKPTVETAQPSTSEKSWTLKPDDSSCCSSPNGGHFHMGASFMHICMGALIMWLTF